MEEKYSNNLVWIDLEMTGLNPKTEVIIEISTIITNNNLEIISKGPSFVIHQDEKFILNMDEWNRITHSSSGLIEKVRTSDINIEKAEEETLKFIKKYCKEGKSPLCGNSVWQDRVFIKKYMPKIDKFLNYRIIDVSSVKEIINRWYPNNPKTEFVKPENHRAEEDIVYSIKELAYYKKHFFQIHDE